MTGPASSPVATAGQPAAWRFPVDAARLFSPGGVPDDYMGPLYVSGEGRMFLYMTDEGNIRRAQWNGAGYDTYPAAENVDAGRTASVVVDEAGKRLFCPSVRQYADGTSGPSIVMIDLTNGSRCNLDETVKFDEKDCRISSDFQYCDGVLLVRLADAKGSLLDKWAVMDIAAKTCRVLDLTDFTATYLPGWREPVSLNLALTGGGRALAVCAAGGYSPPEAAGTGEAKHPYECMAFPLDLTGAPAGDAVLVAGGEQKTCCQLQYGACFRASPDGKRLLFAGAGGGLYVYDIGANRESAVYTGSGAVTFAAWGRDGSIYYAAAASQPAGGYLIYRTDAPDTSISQ
jgi:hypothetical protein